MSTKQPRTQRYLKRAARPLQLRGLERRHGQQRSRHHDQRRALCAKHGAEEKPRRESPRRRRRSSTRSSARGALPHARPRVAARGTSHERNTAPRTRSAGRPRRASAQRRPLSRENQAKVSHRAGERRKARRDGASSSIEVCVEGGRAPSIARHEKPRSPRRRTPKRPPQQQSQRSRAAEPTQMPVQGITNRTMLNIVREQPGPTPVSTNPTTCMPMLAEDYSEAELEPVKAPSRAPALAVRARSFSPAQGPALRRPPLRSRRAAAAVRSTRTSAQGALRRRTRSSAHGERLCAREPRPNTGAEDGVRRDAGPARAPAAVFAASRS